MSFNENEWRDDVEYEEIEIIIQSNKYIILQMKELSINASLFMLSEMETSKKEISGTRLWTGSYLLANFIHIHPDLIQSKCILELGAGLGLCSMIAYSLNNNTIYATDGDEKVVDIMNKNFIKNNMNIHSSKLYWGKKTTEIWLYENSISLNNKSINCIIAGDVLYKESLIDLFFESVLQIFNYNYNNQNNIEKYVLLCHIPRAEVTHEKLVKAINSFHLNYQILYGHHNNDLKEIIFPEECPMEDVVRSKIYKISL